MNLVERLKQQVEGRRDKATPRRIAEQIGRESLSMSRGLDLYPMTERDIEEKRLGSGKGKKRG